MSGICDGGLADMTKLDEVLDPRGLTLGGVKK